MGADPKNQQQRFKEQSIDGTLNDGHDPRESFVEITTSAA
jgi:hypothetical protein